MAWLVTFTQLRCSASTISTTRASSADLEVKSGVRSVWKRCECVFGRFGGGASGVDAKRDLEKSAMTLKEPY